MRQLKIQKSITNRSSEALDKYLVEIGRAPLISIDEEIELAQAIRKGGPAGERAKDKLVTANLRFVVSVAKQYQHQGLTLTDLIDEGNIALIKAAGKFDASKGKRFSQVAVWDIRKAIEAYLPQEEVRMNRTATEHLLGKGKAADQSASEETDKEEMALAIQLLPEREQIVLRAYYGVGEDQLTMAEIGELHGLKRERVRQIRDRAIRRLHSFRNKNFK